MINLSVTILFTESSHNTVFFCLLSFNSTSSISVWHDLTPFSDEALRNHSAISAASTLNMGMSHFVLSAFPIFTPSPFEAPSECYRGDGGVGGWSLVWRQIGSSWPLVREVDNEGHTELQAHTSVCIHHVCHSVFTSWCVNALAIVFTGAIWRQNGGLNIYHHLHFTHIPGYYMFYCWNDSLQYAWRVIMKLKLNVQMINNCLIMKSTNLFFFLFIDAM